MGEEEEKLNRAHATWMADLPEQLTDRPLNQIAIPGSHDTTTYWSDLSGGVACDVVLPSWLKRLVPCLPPCAMRHLQRIIRTQHKPLDQQLRLGVRYLDIRLCQRRGQLWTLHGLYCLKLTQILDIIHEFTETYPKEILFLDFNHFYEMEKSDYCRLCEMVGGFGTKLCPKQPIEDLTLSKMWKNGWQIIAFYNQDEADLKGKDYWWPDTFCPSPWADTMDKRYLFQFLTHHLAKRKTNTFDVTQGILTPDGRWYVLKFWRSIESARKSVRKPLIKWLAKQTTGPKGVNLVITDFVDDEYVNAVLALNKITEPEMKPERRIQMDKRNGFV